MVWEAFDRGDNLFTQSDQGLDAYNIRPLVEDQGSDLTSEFTTIVK
jgi:hypothetical protein